MLVLPMNVTYAFANATTTQYLSSLDADFNQLAWTLNGVSNGTVALANVKINGGTISKSTLAANGSPTSSTFLRGDNTWAAIPSTAGGTVTSIDVSGGSTGLTSSGGPVTSSGTITLAGTLNVVNGGTGTNASTGTGSVVLSVGPTLTNANITSLNLTNPLGITGGGTGIGTVPNYGQILIGNSVGYTLTTITAGSGITITNGPGSITVASSVSIPAPGTLGNVLTSNGTAWVSQAFSGSGGNLQIVFFASSTTWTAPAGVTKVRATVIGGGGGGAVYLLSPDQSGNGGNGGFETGYYTVTPGSSYSITVGAGGTSITGYDVTAGSGGTSSFASFLTCTGGGGGRSLYGNGASGTFSGSNLITIINFPSPYGLLNTSSSPIPWSDGYQAGRGGGSSSIAAFGGTGGAVVIEYIG